MITTRTAILEDLPILLGFEQQLIDFERPFDPTLKTERISYYDIKAMILSDEVEVIVAVEDDEIIGSGYARIEEVKPYLKHNKHAYLGFMFVKDSYRGKGVNKLVVETLYEWILSKDIYEVRLDVYADNVGAIKAYEKVGFKGHLLNMRRDLRE